ncbi:MAG: hypothetical protein J0I12_02370 [Candidatus Eremiobacteraeota bacterium]|nr:hypothetical protein [Candidatus Eremiobacteraeota bacterium]
MSDASYHLEQIAIEAAREHGFNFARPIVGRQLSSPIMHWELIAAPENDKEVVVLLDMQGELLNVEWRKIKVERPQPWWKKALGI